MYTSGDPQALCFHLGKADTNGWDTTLCLDAQRPLIGEGEGRESAVEGGGGSRVYKGRGLLGQWGPRTLAQPSAHVMI